MNTLSATLISIDEIQIRISNSFYGGLTKQVFLRSNDILTELSITTSKQYKRYTDYTIKLDRDIDLSNEYEIVIDRAMRATIDINNIVFNPTFDETYYYDGPLGNFYTKEETTFYVWAPTATSLKVEIKTVNKETVIKEMSRQDKGVYTVSVTGDLELASYVYIVKTSGRYNEAFDPYAYSSTPNSKRSVIIDLNKINSPIDKSAFNALTSFTEFIIYETSVRDFTVSAENIVNKAKFLGLTETNIKSKNNNTVGLDYLEELGITHLQIMPLYDFGSTLEENQMLFYNWGYDPVNYNVPEGSYITDVFDAYKRITETKAMIQAINNKGIRVNMDVVYNHMFDINSSCFHNLVPMYYFRYDKRKRPSNGSFCGNDIESTHLMARRFIIDSVKRWITLYGMDGFRFDLMGIHDVDTMNILRTEVDKINPMIIINGEGWHMPSTLKDSLKSSIQNQEKVPNIAMFNDRFRDSLKGPHSDLKKEGFLCGNVLETNTAASCLSGTVLPFLDVKTYMNKPTTTINYVSCHDNYTIYDQYKLKYDDDTLIKQYQSLNLSFLLITQGIIFIHSGSEFFRTKLGEENSYNTSDEENHIDWQLRDQHIEHINYIKELIKIRKSFKGYHLSTNEDLKKHTNVEVLKPGVLKYTISYGNTIFTHFINATSTLLPITIKDTQRLLSNGFQADINGLGTVSDIVVKPFSITIVKG